MNDFSQRPYQVLDRQAEELRTALYRHGSIAHGYWHHPGLPQIIYTGTRNPRRGYDALTATNTIIIKAGRAPSAVELDQIVAATLAETFPPEEFVFAAAA